MANKRLVVLISGNGTNLQAVIDACASKYLSCDVVGVVSSKTDAYGIQRARRAHIPFETVCSRDFNGSRHDYDCRLLTTVKNYRPDLVVCAGFMRVLTSAFIDAYRGRLINLHPSLPGGLIGTDCIKRTWNLYNGIISPNEACWEGVPKEDIMKKLSGAMVHQVVEDVDMGTPIATMNVNIEENDTFEDYESRFHLAERSLLVSTLKSLSDNVEENDFVCIDENVEMQKFQTGKVRQMYDCGKNVIAIEHSDRLSAFDRHITNIPNKGEVLCATSAWWFRKIEKELGIKTHHLWSSDNVMFARKCRLLPIEVVVRGYMTGSTNTSIWPMYKSGNRNMYGIKFRDGYSKNEALDEVILTPTTKGEVDEPITADEIVKQGYMTQEQWDEVSSNTLRVFKWSQKVAAERGLILVDTKYEWGVDLETGDVTLIDEVNTCDSSRYWLANTYDERFADGKEPEKYDKDVVRDHIKKTVDDPYSMTDFSDVVTPELIHQTASVYNLFFNTLTNRLVGLQTRTNQIERTVVSDVVGDGTASRQPYGDFSKLVSHFMYNEYAKHYPLVVILSGSTSDAPHVNKIKKCCNEQGLHVHIHYGSAHKETLKVLNTINSYNDQKGRVVFVCVAGMSNALGGVTACNTHYPVISCPPFKNEGDQALNINSTLQMPSKVPAATVLSPGNTALFIKRMFCLP